MFLMHIFCKSRKSKTFADLDEVRKNAHVKVLFELSYEIRLNYFVRKLFTLNIK